MSLSKVMNEQTELLVKGVLSLRSEEEAYDFFEDVCTIKEIQDLAQRLSVARLLRRHVTYHEIAEMTGASTATISRVNRALTYGAGGYDRVLDRLDEEETADGPK